MHDPRTAIALTLRGERFARLVVQVDDPSATIAAIRAGIAAIRAGIARFVQRL